MTAAQVFLMFYLRNTSCDAVPGLFLGTTSTFVYKVQLRLIVMSLENPMHRGELSFPAHIMLQTELSRLPSSVGITSGISVVTSYLISYFVISMGMNLSSCAPQSHKTEETVNQMQTSTFELRGMSMSRVVTVPFWKNLVHSSRDTLNCCSFKSFPSSVHFL